MVGADIFIFSKIHAPMAQTNHPEKKPNGDPKEDSLEEIIGWGSPIATVSNTSQEELFSCNKALDFLDDDEDTFINESFCKKNENREECISNGYANRLNLGDEDLDLQEAPGKEKELILSKDSCRRYCNEYSQDDVYYGGNCTVFGQHNDSETDRYNADGEELIQESWRFSSNAAIPNRINSKDDHIFGIRDNYSEVSDQKTAVRLHRTESDQSCSSECEPSNENHNSHVSSAVSLKDILGDEEEESSEDLFGHKTPSNEDTSHSDALDAISGPSNAGLRCHDNIKSVDSHLSFHGIGKTSIHKSSGSSASEKPKLDHPVVKSCGESFLVYVRVCTRRCFGDKVVEGSMATVQLHRPIIPTISEDSFRDKTVFRVLAIKNLVNDRSMICSLLNIEEKDIFDSHISVVIDKDFLNDSIMKDRKILNSAESIFEFIRCSNENIKNILKFKMGLGSGRLTFEPGNLYQIASSGDKYLARSFILSQKNSMLFFVLFYKLGLAELEDYKDIFCNNIYHQYILTMLGVWKNSTARQSNGGWSIMNVVDFGISKILSIDQEQRKEKHNALDKLMSSKKTLGKGTGDGDLLKIDPPVISELLRPGDMLQSTPNDASNPEACLSSREGHSKQGDLCLRNNRMPVTNATKTAPGGLIHASLAAKASSSGTQSSFSDMPEDHVAKGALALFDDSDDDFEMFGSPLRENSGKDIQRVTKNDLVDGHQEDSVLHIDSTTEDTQSTKCEEANVISDTNENTKVSLPVDHMSSEDRASLGSVNPQDISDIPDDKSKLENMIYKTGLGSKSSSDLEQENPVYKKKFSKSFADIFTLEGDDAVPSNLDVSSYVLKAEERDRPLMQSCDESDSKTSVISSLFGFFKKKQPESSANKDDPYMNRFNMPLKAEIRLPEKERKVVHSFYANRKQAEGLEIPGFKQSKR